MSASLCMTHSPDTSFHLLYRTIRATHSLMIISQWRVRFRNHYSLWNNYVLFFLSYQTFLGQRVSFQSSCVCSEFECSSAGCIRIPPHTTTDWIFCSAAQIPLNWNFKWKLSRFAADQRITWKHVMSHGKGTGLGNTDELLVPRTRPL